MAGESAWAIAANPDRPDRVSQNSGCRTERVAATARAIRRSDPEVNPEFTGQTARFELHTHIIEEVINDFS